jgi:signal transduction histidine kinase
MGLVIMNGAAERAGAYLVLTQVASHAGELAGPPAPGQHSREVCHDMRQPVAGMLSLAWAALTVPELPGAARSWLEQIVAQVETLAELIERSLDRDDPVGGTLRTDLGQLARAVVAGEQLTYRGMLHTSVPSQPVLADVNRVDARRIVANLLSNATRAAGPDGSVTVRVAREPGCARLVVQDTGPGFGRISPSTGLGIGVIPRCLVRCGGRIGYEQGPDGGAEATVSLPLGPRLSQGGRPTCG